MIYFVNRKYFWASIFQPVSQTSSICVSEARPQDMGFYGFNPDLQLMVCQLRYTFHIIKVKAFFSA